MDTCMCMAESLCCSPETITTLLIGYIPIQNKKLQKKKKKVSQNWKLKQHRFTLSLSWRLEVQGAGRFGLPQGLSPWRRGGHLSLGHHTAFGL